jgi:hypothetical protein
MQADVNRAIGDSELRTGSRKTANQQTPNSLRSLIDYRIDLRKCLRDVSVGSVFSPGSAGFPRPIRRGYFMQGNSMISNRLSMGFNDDLD